MSRGPRTTARSRCVPSTSAAAQLVFSLTAEARLRRRFLDPLLGSFGLGLAVPTVRDRFYFTDPAARGTTSSRPRRSPRSWIWAWGSSFPDGRSKIVSKVARAASTTLNACPRSRAVFVLFELEELPMAGVAVAVGCPLQTAYARLYAARSIVEVALRPRREPPRATSRLTLPRSARIVGPRKIVSKERAGLSTHRATARCGHSFSGDTPR